MMKAATFLVLLACAGAHGAEITDAKVKGYRFDEVPCYSTLTFLSDGVFGVKVTVRPRMHGSGMVVCQANQPRPESVTLAGRSASLAKEEEDQYQNALGATWHGYTQFWVFDGGLPDGDEVEGEMILAGGRALGLKSKIKNLRGK